MVVQNVILAKDDDQTLMNPNAESLLNELGDSLEQLLDYLDDFPDTQLNGKPSPDAWSVLQVCHHLMLAEDKSLKYLKKKLSYNPKLKKASMATTMRIKLLKTYLNTPMKFKAPDSLAGSAIPEQSTLSEITYNWKENRRELRAYLATLPVDLFEKEIYKHPFAGRLSLEGMLVFFKEHFNRHQKQINKILRKVG